MSLRFRVSMFACVFTAVMGSLLRGSTAQAQSTWYWTTAGGTVQAGNGAWDTATANWSTSVTGDATPLVWSNNPLNNADFYANSSPTSAITVNGNQTVGNVIFDGTGYTVGGAGTLTVAGSIITNQNATINAVISGTNLVTGGNGVLTLGGANAYSGATVISAGTLQLNGLPALPQVAFNFNSSSGTASGSTVYNAGSLSSAYNGTLNGTASIATGVGPNGGNALSIPNDSSASYLFLPNVSLASGSWTASAWYYGYYSGGGYATLFDGNENQVLTHSNSLGTYRVSDYSFHAASPTVTLTNQAAWNQVTAVASGGTTSFYIDGNFVGSSNYAGSGWINAVGNYTGGTQPFAEYVSDVDIYQSALSAAQVKSLYASSSNGNTLSVLPAGTPVQIAAGAALDLNGSLQQVASLNDYVAGVSYGAVTNSSATLATLTLAPTSGTATFSGVIGDGSGGVSLAINGTGTQVLAGANTFSGTTTVSAGTLNLSNQYALQNSALTPAGGSVVFDQSVAGHAFTMGGLSGSGNIALQDNAAAPDPVALTVGGNNVSTTFLRRLERPGEPDERGHGRRPHAGRPEHVFRRHGDFHRHAEIERLAHPRGRLQFQQFERHGQRQHRLQRRLAVVRL